MNILIALCLGVLSTACGGDDPADGPSADANALTVSVSDFTFGPKADKQTFEVTSQAGWSVLCDDSWVSVQQSTSKAGTGTVTVSVTENTGTTARTSTITVKSGTTRKYVAVTQNCNETAAIQCPIEGYDLVWNDEFEGTSVDESKWTYQTANAGWVNNELQYYVSGGKTPAGDYTAYVSNGSLKITALKENGKVYSARMYGRKSIGFKYCYIEASIKLPTGKGTWPAFWMMPSEGGSWPACGEIDIMEEVGYAPNVVVSTIHCTKYNNTGSSIESARKTLAGAQTEFHRYGMEWTKDYMTFYVDGVQLLKYKNDGTGTAAWPFDKAFYPILNLAWGGEWGGQQGIDESCLPATMEVDYVRVWQKK